MPDINKNNRREFLMKTGRAGIAAGIAASIIPSWACATGKTAVVGSVTGEEIPYEQQPLPYAYTALEPVIDAMTMEIHYSKHAATYAKNLADALKAENVDTGKDKLTSLLGKISKYSPKMRNNGGGHYNHEFFWKSMRASVSSNAPDGSVQNSIIKDFGSFDAFKTQFTDAGKNRFGSGWAWLVKTADKKLVVYSTPNQDNPLMDISEVKGTPLLGLDVWEHAYYLKYQNRRPDYITAWWNVVDWKVVQKRFDTA
ncbi:MAG: superoxide dismutase [Bacteroidota bacterium]|nr:superoxide dismutase [Bacteroidota bacterium]